MISIIKIGEKDVKFKTSVLAYKDFASKKDISFDEGLKLFGKNLSIEDTISLFHSSISTIKGQEDITLDNVWEWVDEDIGLMNKMLTAMVESTPKNVLSPMGSGQK